jgi:bacteriocin-like protein
MDVELVNANANADPGIDNNGNTISELTIEEMSHVSGGGFRSCGLIHIDK